MKRLLLTAPVMFAAFAASWLSAQTPFPLFTTASLKGTCGFTEAANEVTGPHFLPRPAVGTLTFNGAGTVSLTGTRNAAGTIQTLSNSGTYSVGADGRTGTMDFRTSGGGVIQFAITSGGAQLHFINTNLGQVLVGQCDF